MEIEKRSEIFVTEVKDVEEIFNILSSFSERLKDERVESEESRRDYAEKIAKLARFVVAYLGNDAVGCFAAYMNDKENGCIYCTYLAIKDDIGALSGLVLVKMFSYGMVLAKKLNLSKFRLEVDKNNHKAVRCYKELGYEYVSDSADNRMYMEISLPLLDKKLNALSRILNRSAK